MGPFKVDRLSWLSWPSWKIKSNPKIASPQLSWLSHTTPQGHVLERELALVVFFLLGPAVKCSPSWPEPYPTFFPSLFFTWLGYVFSGFSQKSLTSLSLSLSLSLPPPLFILCFSVWTSAYPPIFRDRAATVLQAHQLRNCRHKAGKKV